MIAPEWEDPAGVPIDAFLFGGRRATVVPLVSRGIRLGARRLPRRDDVGRDDRRRRRRGRRAALRPDGDAAVLRLQHGRLLRPLAAGSADASDVQAAEDLLVNWFRKDEDGKFLWPGFGENSRVLEWVFRRCDGEGETVETPLGLLPAEGELNIEGLDVSAEAHARSCSASTPRLLREQLPQVEEYLAKFGDRLPDEITGPARGAEAAPRARRRRGRARTFRSPLETVRAAWPRGCRLGR